MIKNYYEKMKTKGEEAKRQTQRYYTQLKSSLRQNQISFRRKLNDYYHNTRTFLSQGWQTLKPIVENAFRGAIALSTATSTLTNAMKIAPIVLSVLTVFATAPLMSALLPRFLFHNVVIFFVLGTISVCAGYFKYRELAIRSRLDRQTEKNQKEIEILKKKLEEMHTKITTLESQLFSFRSKTPSSSIRRPRMAGGCALPRPEQHIRRMKLK